ncbi:lig_chan-Glu_bd domain-containing protein [Caerostris darwini]|uniref:Lig_chan-Glu_bd domain-containing protein n=1 Tax=Caerostris darwini TaxID=1538125 RepID=A0AAV4W8G8_9ARAC|nr:lig_chan-Glu_bd domain-containing protein [Caerostris darwini]
MDFPNFLRIAVVPLRYAVELDFDEKSRPSLSGGLEANIINLLSTTLGFEYEIFPAKDKEWGRLRDNGTWSGVIGMVYRNESDIGLGYLSVTTNRSEVVDFIPYSTEENTFATRLPPFLSPVTEYTYPFEKEVWVAFAFAIFFTPIVFKVITSNNVSIPSLAAEMIGCLLRQNLNIPIKKARDMFLMGSWLIFASILSFCYVGVLLSSVSVPLREKGIRTIRKLSEGVSDGKFKCFANRGSVGIALLKDSFDKDLQMIGKHIIEKNWISEDKTLKFPKTIEKSVALLGPRTFFRLEYGEKPFTTKYIFEESVSFSNVGIAVNKNFCCKERLNMVIKRFVETGIIKKLYNNILFETQHGLELEDDLSSSYTAMNFDDFKDEFLLLGIGYVLSFFTLFFEIIHPLP